MWNKGLILLFAVTLTLVVTGCVGGGSCCT